MVGSSAELGSVLNVIHKFKATRRLYQEGSADDADGSIHTQKKDPAIADDWRSVRLVVQNSYHFSLMFTPTK